MVYRHNNETTHDENEGSTCMIVKNKCRNIKTNWVGDSLITYHIVNSKEYMYDTRSPNGDIVVVDVKYLKVENVGDIDILLTNRDVSKVKMTLKDV